MIFVGEGRRCEWCLGPWGEVVAGVMGEGGEGFWQRWERAEDGVRSCWLVAAAVMASVVVVDGAGT